MSVPQLTFGGSRNVGKAQFPPTKSLRITSFTGKVVFEDPPIWDLLGRADLEQLEVAI